MPFEVPEIQAMLEVAKQWKAAPWLRPLTPSFIPPGGRLLRTLTGHTGVVNAVAATPDGKRVISGAEDYTLKVWDLETGSELFSLNGHTGIVEAVAVTPNGKGLISGSVGNNLKVWNIKKVGDLKTAKELFTLKVWNIKGFGDLKTAKELFTLKGHTGSVESVVVTPDSNRLISASWDNTIKIWNLESGEELSTLEGHIGFVNAVAATPDGKWVISASNDKTLKIWDLETRKIIASFCADGELLACAVAPDGVTIVAGEASGRVHFLRLEGV
jgi:WD40 repeat protein